MSFMKANQDELLDGFCRGCLQRYGDPGDLLHYTERNRRLFVYCTGIQVKRNDTLTFQICKECYVNMRVSCRFKKQCRISDRRFKSFLRCKEVGESVDLVTFLRNSENDLKFPTLSGYSTPAHQKKDDDNDSTCASIRNFMTDILQGEEMPDSEARIIKEVIEEEADLLEDSLDSHWLQDEASIDGDSRLDFSFSPYATPRSVNNDHCYTPIRQLEPSLRCTNNHAKKVLLQLPTSRYINDDPISVSDPNKEKSQSKNLTHKTQIDQTDRKTVASDTISKELANEDSIAEFIKQNEDFIMKNDNTNITAQSIAKEIALKALENSKDVEKQKYISLQNPTEESISVDSLAEKSPIVKSKSILTESDIAVKNLSFHTFGRNSADRGKSSLPKSDMAMKNTDLNVMEIGTSLIKDKHNLIETNKAVKSISLCNFGGKSERETGKGVAVYTVDKNIDITEQEFSVAETEILGKNIGGKIFESNMAAKAIRVSDSDNIEGEDNLLGVLTSKINDAAAKSIIIEQIDNSMNISKKIEHTPDTALAVQSTINIKSVLKENSIISEDVNDLCEEIAEITTKHRQSNVDTIDKNLENALNNQGNEDFSLDDLLVSPNAVRTPVKPIETPEPGSVTGISTPVINNILFGDKLDEDSSNGDIKLEKVDEEYDALDEFFKEGVKDFEKADLIKKEMPLELKYDLKEARCKMCVKKFETTRALKIHLNKVHQIRFPRAAMARKSGVCNFCGIVINDVRNMARHVRSHIKSVNQEFKCSVCKVVILSEAKYKMHLKVHDIETPEENKPVHKKYMCNICGATFKEHGNFHTHKRRHTTNYTHVCKDCDKGFFRASDLSIHIMRHHTGERPFKCTHCDSAFIAKYILAKHMRLHTVEKRYECDRCGRTFVSKHQVARHIKTSKRCKNKGRKIEKPKRARKMYRCPYCADEFTAHMALVRHQNNSACWEVIKSSFNEFDESMHSIKSERKEFEHVDGEASLILGS